MNETSKYVADFLRSFLEEHFELSVEVGQALWTVVAGEEILFPGLDKPYRATFRYWGDLIAEVIGEGDYGTYYCSFEYIDSDLARQIREKLIDEGVKFVTKPLHCSKCGREIGKWEPKAFELDTGRVLCTKCAFQPDLEVEE